MDGDFTTPGPTERPDLERNFGFLLHDVARLMRAEFDRPRLPHRSFIPELQRSAQGKAFR